MLSKAIEHLVQGENVHRKIQAAIRVYNKILTMVKKWKLRWLEDISGSSGLAKMILQGTVKGKI